MAIIRRALGRGTLAAALAVGAAGCKAPVPVETAGASEVLQDSRKSLPDLVPAEPTAPGETKSTPSGVKYQTVKPGDGPAAKAGERLSMHYVGTLENGEKFDSSRDRGQPFKVTIGVGDVIRGWDEGVPGMKVGEVRTLTIPPEAGYGARGAGGKIPPNAVLKFEVELVSIP